MAVIKIPSSNIFSNEYVVSNLKDKISSINATPKEYLEAWDVLSDYTITLHVETNPDSEPEDRQFLYVGDDTDKNAVPFRIVDEYLHYAKNVDENGKALPIFFPIDKLCHIQVTGTGQNGYYRVTNLSALVTETRYHFKEFLGVPVGYHDTQTRYSFVDSGDTTILCFNNQLRKLKYGRDGASVLFPFVETLQLTVQEDNNYDPNYLTQVNIKVFGAYVKPETSEYSYPISSPNKNLFSLPESEIVQSDLSFVDIYGTEVSYLDKLSQEVINQYKDGKEVVKIKCSLSEYYDTDGNLAISLTENKPDGLLPMTFKKYDIVEPYIYINECEKPIVENPDGTAKKFQVIGVDFDYAGVPWQTLTLQSYTES